MKRLLLMLAGGFGLGSIPVAPGTFGSLLGLPLAYGLTLIPSLPIRWSLVGLLLLIGIPICEFAQRDAGKSDPGWVVYDEIAAFPLVFLFTPFSGLTATLGFVWFRVFDIGKPPPLGRLERIPGGTGVMADDVGAAIYAAGALWLTMWLVPATG